MKKAIILWLVTIMCIALAACSKPAESDKSNADNVTQTTEPIQSTPAYSTGLEYEANGDGTLSVKGIGLCQDKDVVIPPYYEGMKVTSIAECAFERRENLNSVTLADGMTSIGDSAFEYCKSLTSITIPSSVTSLGYGTFYGCESLTKVNIPDGVTFIDGYVFHGCCSLTSITIPSSVTAILDHAFSYCESLENIELPSGIKYIENHLFLACQKLESVTIPSSVVKIENGAFSSCGSLAKIHFSGTKAQWKKIYKLEHWESACGEYTIYCTDGNIGK